MWNQSSVLVKEASSRILPQLEIQNGFHSDFQDSGCLRTERTICGGSMSKVAAIYAGISRPFREEALFLLMFCILTLAVPACAIPDHAFGRNCKLESARLEDHKLSVE